MRSVRILAISGSLRASSSNSTLLEAVRELAPPGMVVRIWDGLATLPHFNPDQDAQGEAASEPVRAFRAEVAAADGLLISSPEYAHGVPGSLKNALDWLVSSPEIILMPVGLLNASPRSTHAQASLAETLKTMSTELVPEACLPVPLSGRRLDVRGVLADPELVAQLRSALDALGAASRRSRELERRAVPPPSSESTPR